MKTWLMAALAAAVLASCAKITQDNFAKIHEGMTEQEVIALLGEPTEANSVNVLGVSGTSARWAGNDAEITIRIVNGKVALKRFDKPAAR